MLKEIFYIFLLTFFPGLELRWSIPIAILGLDFTIPVLNITVQLDPVNPLIVFFVAVIANFILGIIVYEILYKIIIFLTTKSVFFKRLYDNFILRLQKKSEKIIRKYGWIGLALFISIPLPGSGVYSGAFVSHIFGLERKQFYIASFLGVLTAGIIVTILTLTGRIIL